MITSHCFFFFCLFPRTFQGPELFPNLFAQLTAQQLCFTCVHVHFFYMNAQRQMLSVACVKGMGATVATYTVQRHHMRFLTGRNATIKTGQLDFLFVLSTKMLWNKLKCLHEGEKNKSTYLTDQLLSMWLCFMLSWMRHFD